MSKFVVTTHQGVSKLTLESALLFVDPSVKMMSPYAGMISRYRISSETLQRFGPDMDPCDPLEALRGLPQGAGTIDRIGDSFIEVVLAPGLTLDSENLKIEDVEAYLYIVTSPVQMVVSNGRIHYILGDSLVCTHSAKTRGMDSDMDEGYAQILEAYIDECTGVMGEIDLSVMTEQAIASVQATEPLSIKE